MVDIPVVALELKDQQNRVEDIQSALVNAHIIIREFKNHEMDADVVSAISHFMDVALEGLIEGTAEQASVFARHQHYDVQSYAKQGKSDAD